ncbi:sulfotransferase [Alterisphingorhabdus coralli]|uniref:Sulfotransferase n=1 Tax=Alterisphingorhabdus coralli TaxID=3071408 RepID=A0AA97F657_9SPHN|nr:sulfotransferase [Parasphingorhabdus sp. SCSIO 66989]WOE75069.1 sulfotransferase [Parasphingorhabdus sp. SCSIO 66989]
MKGSEGENGTFVLGPGRCGSTMLSNILNLHPDILSLFEFFSTQGVRSLLPGKISGKRYWQQLSTQTRSMRVMFTAKTAPSEFLYREGMGRFPIDNLPPLLVSTLPHISDNPQKLFDELARIVPRFPDQTIEAHHDRLFRTLQERLGRKIWVERTGLSQMYVKLLPRLFPEAKFILLYRDGRDVALSMQAFKPIRPAIWNWKWSGRFGPNPIDLDNPAGRSRHLRFNDRVFAVKPLVRWMVDTPPSLEDCAGFWSELMLTSIPEFLSLAEDRRHYLEYTRLVDDPKHELDRLAYFLEVEPDKTWLDAASAIPKRLEPRWKRLDADMQAKLSDWTAEAREATGRLSSARA